MRFWVSWVQRTDDYRPLTDPPNKGILGWWCSGFDVNDNAILCAAVDAKNEMEAQEAVFNDWPEAEAETDSVGWRFFQHATSGWRPSDRFPLKPWMQERFDRTT